MHGVLPVLGLKMIGYQNHFSSISLMSLVLVTLSFAEYHPICLEVKKTSI